MPRVYNFSAGPSMLPEPVLNKAAAELLDYQGSGQSVMEMSHRSKVFMGIYEEGPGPLAGSDGHPGELQGAVPAGRRLLQFAAVPMNLMTKSGKADYVLSGQFSTKAYKEAARYGPTARSWPPRKTTTSPTSPLLNPQEFRPDADYFHICMNNTIYGTVWSTLPDTGSVPLVADISSCILSKPIDVSKFGLLYAGAQKT